MVCSCFGKVLIIYLIYLTALSKAEPLTKSEQQLRLAVYWDSSTESLRHEYCAEECQRLSSNVVAYGIYTSSLFDIGWNTLYVETNGDYSDIQQAYVAGYIEGVVTQNDVSNHWRNTIDDTCNQSLNVSTYCKDLKDFLETNLNYVKSTIAQEEGSSDYWHQVELFYYQVAGLSDGYKNKSIIVNMDIDVFGVYLFQLAGDMEDLKSVLNSSYKRMPGSGHCSALVKLLPDNAEIFASQDTWDGYSSMLRILKVYNYSFHVLPESKDIIPGSVMKFSSYPGVLMSGDDFYTLSSNMVAMETTIGFSNASLNQNIRANNSVFEGIRAMVANRLATSGKSWAFIFSQQNSGTYNNEWMIVDYKQFVPFSKPLNPGVLTVLDQIPGLIWYDDLTDELQKTGYFASYNIPYSTFIFNMSGGQENVKKYGDWFSHEHTPRANIFRRDQGNVWDLPSMLYLMRYNNYKVDPLSACACNPPYSAENAISARSDLNPANGSYSFNALGHRSHGGTDMKVTTSALMSQLNFLAWAGPTYTDLPPFQWSTSGLPDAHFGHPDLFKFEPILFSLAHNSSLPFLPFHLPKK